MQTSASSGGTIRFKIVLLGEGRVGKTSLFLRYIHDSYNEKQTSTIRATYLEKSLTIGMQRVVLSIWDTAGQERFHSLGPIYYRDAHGALLVYDITDRDSFSKVRDWVKELRTIVGTDIVLLICGNKIDLERSRQVSDEEAEAYAQSVGAQHFKASAKTGKNVEETFLQLAKNMLARRPAEQGKGKRSGKSALVEDESASAAASQRSCC